MTPTEKAKKKTVDIVCCYVPSHSLNQSLLGAGTQDTKDYIKPTTARKSDMVILHTGTNDLKNNQNQSDVDNEIINLAKNIKIRRMKVSIHP